MRIMQIIQACINLIFPITCIGCGDIGDYLCIQCITQLDQPEHNLPDWIITAYNYKNPIVRKCILHLKEYPNKHLTDILIKNIYNQDSFAPSLTPDPSPVEREKTLCNKNLDDKIFIIPVPMTRDRFYERGFNQAEIIAGSVLPYYPASILCTDAVVKESGHAKQATLTEKSSRIKNAEHIFHITKPAVIAGRDILIVDDLVTSGATISALRDELLSAGARSVKGFAVGH